MAAAKAAKPAGIWMTFPPAKSMAPILYSHPFFFFFQYAMGEYIIMLKHKVKIRMNDNLILPTIEPTTKAGVIAANIV